MIYKYCSYGFKQFRVTTLIVSQNVSVIELVYNLKLLKAMFFY